MNIGDQDLERIKEFYRTSLREHGENDPRTLHWMNAHSQAQRFAILTTVAPIAGSRILDVGCGMGDLFGYLEKRGIRTDYTGIDILPDFIDIAKKRFPDGTFKQGDIFDVHESYDYVFASGSLTFKLEGDDSYYKTMIRRMYDLSKKAAAFNMLRNDRFAGNDLYATYSPHVIGEFCKTFCGDVQIVIDYLPDDFSVFLYKK